MERIKSFNNFFFCNLIPKYKYQLIVIISIPIITVLILVIGHYVCIYLEEESDNKDQNLHITNSFFTYATEFVLGAVVLFLSLFVLIVMFYTFFVIFEFIRGENVNYSINEEEKNFAKMEGGKSNILEN